MHESQKKTDEVELYKPWATDQNNLNERRSIFGKTAQASDQIRAEVNQGNYLGKPAQELYWQFHEAFVKDNSLAYLQDDIPTQGAGFFQVLMGKTIEQYIRPGMLRNEPSDVGDYINTPVEALEVLSRSYFDTMNPLLQHSEKIKSLEPDDKLVLLILCERFLIQSHLPKNASGRVNEEFISFLAHTINIQWSISESGFRGQIDNNFEEEVEKARWIYRDQTSATPDNGQIAIDQINHAVEVIQRGTPQEIHQYFIQLQEDEEANGLTSLAAHLEVFREATQRKYTFLPQDPELQQLLIDTVSHLVFIKVEKYSHIPNDRQRSPAIVYPYLKWHERMVQQGITKLLASSEAASPILENIRVIFEEERKKIIQPVAS